MINSPLPWYVKTLGNPDPLEHIEHKDAPSAELRDANGDIIALFPRYYDAEYVLSLFDKIKVLEQEVKEVSIEFENSLLDKQ